MTWALVGAASVAMAVAARPPAADATLVGHRYPSVSEALAVALSSRPLVVAFGEFHQTAATAHIPSALRRFTEQILPALSPKGTPPPSDARPGESAGAPRFSHLVVETWIASGRCGEAERIVTEDVQKTTERPAATEGEIEILLRAAVERGVAPRILAVGCADYQAMRSAPSQGGDGGPVDYDRALRVTARALEKAALGALRERRAGAAASSPPHGQAGQGETAAGYAPSAPPTTAVAVYGGALHNDVHPEPSLAPYSFAPLLQAATLGRYLEIDLIVPEYAADSASLRAQPWWRPYLRALRADPNRRSAGRHIGATVLTEAVVLLRRSSLSFVIVFPRSDTKRGSFR